MFLEKVLRYKEIIGYGVTVALLFCLLQFLEYKFVVFNYRMEIYISLIAVLFTGLGIWLALKLATPKTVVIERTVSSLFVQNQHEISERKISKRELEVLELMAEGFSNQEIASKLFVSLNTVKSHSSNIFEKLEVKRRTQAVEAAKKLQIIE